MFADHNMAVCGGMPPIYATIRDGSPVIGMTSASTDFGRQDEEKSKMQSRIDLL